MKTKIRKNRKAFVDTGVCVACGCCVKVCPKNALHIHHGITAKIDLEKCVGCGKCAKECPASVIEIREVDDEKALV
ncbi:MAG: DUF362 domain-containing protein [Ruminococcus sp.]|jgi:ferredoxin